MSKNLEAVRIEEGAIARERTLVRADGARVPKGQAGGGEFASGSGGGKKKKISLSAKKSEPKKAEPKESMGKRVLGAIGKVAKHVPIHGSSILMPSIRVDEEARVPKGQPGGGRFAGGGGTSRSGANAQITSPGGSMHHGGVGIPIAKPAPVEMDPAHKERLAKDIEHHISSSGPKTTSELQQMTGASKAEVQAAMHHLVKGGSHYVEGRTGRLKERVRLPNAAEGGGVKPWKKHLAAGIRGGLEGMAIGAGVGAAAGEGIGAIPGAAIGLLIGASAGGLSSHLEEPAIARTGPALTKHTIAEVGRRRQVAEQEAQKLKRKQSAKKGAQTRQQKAQAPVQGTL